MTARDLISPASFQDNPDCDMPQPASPHDFIDADTHIIDTLHRMLDSGMRRLDVVDGENRIGVITQESLLEGLGKFLTPRDDSSYVIIECAPEDYSASAIAHAVEDADAHLTDLWSSPAGNNRIRVTLRVRRDDPSPVVRSLERYNFFVADTFSRLMPMQAEIASRRIDEIRALFNV